MESARAEVSVNLCLDFIKNGRTRGRKMETNSSPYAPNVGENYTNYPISALVPYYWAREPGDTPALKKKIEREELPNFLNQVVEVRVSSV